MLTTIKCPKCNTEGKFSLSDAVYDGPYRCWKCKELFRIRMENHVLVSCEPLDPNEEAKLEEIRAIKDKFRHGGS